MSEISYHLSGESWRLQFTPDVISILSADAQVSPDAPESVGQLYSRDLTRPILLVERATKLPTSMASRTKVKFDPKQAFEERKQLFKDGLHCVGIWHTHPEPYASPSGEDKVLARDYAQSARVQVPGIVFAIVGTVPYPHGLRVWFDDGNSLRSMPVIERTLDSTCSA